MKKLELFIPDRTLDEVNDILKDANVGGMSHYRIEGRGLVKPEAIYIGRSTKRYKPEFIPRTKVEVVVDDKKAEELISIFRNKLGDDIGGKIFVLDVVNEIDLKATKTDENVL